MTRRNLVPLLLIIVAGLGLNACQQSQPVRPSGYLVNYKLLKPTDRSAQTLYYEDSEAPWHQYHSIMFEEVVIRVAPGHGGEPIDADDIAQLRNYFQRTLANHSCQRLAFTNRPGEGVILLRSAIVDVEPVNVAANVVSKGLFFVPVDLGKAAIEGELRDSVTGRHLASIVDREFSSLIDPTHSYTTWGTVEDAFDSWGEQLGQILDRNLSRAENQLYPLR